MQECRRRVLLVEDDDAHARMFEMAVDDAMLDIAIDRSKDGADALAILKREGLFCDHPAPDVVVLDLNLPRMGGHEVLQCVKRDEYLRLIPVVVLSTSVAERDLAQAYENGTNAYVAKPADFDQFLRVIHDLLTFWIDWNRTAEPEWT